MLEKHKWFKSAKKLGKPRNVSKNMTSEQYQVFGANLKVGLRKIECFCRALTRHILSQDFKRVSLRVEPPIPKAEYFSLGQVSKLERL